MAKVYSFFPNWQNFAISGRTVCKGLMKFNDFLICMAIDSSAITFFMYMWYIAKLT